MALRAGHRDHPIDRAATTDFYHIAQYVRIGRFADQTVINNFALLLKPAKHFARAVNARAFFVAGDEKGNRAADISLRLLMRRHGGDKSRNRAFHIGRASSPKGLLANVTGKRVCLPIICIADRHDICVTGKTNMWAVTAAPRIEIINRFRAVFLERQARADKAEIF